MAYKEKWVMKNFSLTIPAGITTCVMAPSGSGKTTLLRLLMGLERPLKGSITGMEGQKNQRRLSGGPSVRTAGRRLQYPSSLSPPEGRFCAGTDGSYRACRMRRTAGRGTFRRDAAPDRSAAGPACGLGHSFFWTSPSAAWIRIPKAGRWLIPAPYAKTVPWYSSPMTRRKRKESGPDGR